jgi:hypothetical protein
MEKCSGCGAETELVFMGVPICLACAEIAQAMKIQELAEVNVKLTAAREEYQKALALQRKADEIRKNLPLGHPDGLAALDNANRELSSASERYNRTLKEFLDFGRPKT